MDPGQVRGELGVQQRNSGLMGDTMTALKQGVEQLPGMITGIADMPTALTGGYRPFTAAAGYLGEKTGFQPGKWAKEADNEYSQGHREEAGNVEQAWKQIEGAGFMDQVKELLTNPEIAKAYATNPAYTLTQVIQSLPSMAAGGVASRGLMIAGRAAGLAEGAGAGYLERAVGSKWAAPVAGGVGEGAVSTGQQMDQYTGPDQQRNAWAALGAGAGDALIAMGAGRIAQRMGLETHDTLMAGKPVSLLGEGVDAERRILSGGRPGDPGFWEKSMPRRMLAGGLNEAILQELPQSMQEQVFQNLGEGKPWYEGVVRQGVEGGLAGGLMGAGANVGGHVSAQEHYDLLKTTVGAREDMLRSGNEASLYGAADAYGAQRAQYLDPVQAAQLARAQEELYAPPQLQQVETRPGAAPGTNAQFNPTEEALRAAAPGETVDVLSHVATPSVETPGGAPEASGVVRDPRTSDMFKPRMTQAEAEKAGFIKTDPVAKERAELAVAQHQMDVLTEVKATRGKAYKELAAKVAALKGVVDGHDSQVVRTGGNETAQGTQVQGANDANAVSVRGQSAEGASRPGAEGSEVNHAPDAAVGTDAKGQAVVAPTTPELDALESRINGVMNSQEQPERGEAPELPARAPLDKEGVAYVANALHQRGDRNPHGPFAKLFEALKSWDKTTRDSTRANSEQTQEKHFGAKKEALQQVIPLLYAMEREFGTKGVNAIVGKLKSMGTTNTIGGKPQGEKAGITDEAAHARLAAAWSGYKTGNLTAGAINDKTVRGNYMEEKLDAALRAAGVTVATKLQDDLKDNGIGPLQQGKGTEGWTGRGSGIMNWLERGTWQGFSEAEQSMMRTLYAVFKKRGQAPFLQFKPIPKSSKNVASFNHATNVLTIYQATKDNPLSGETHRDVLHELEHAVTQKTILSSAFDRAGRIVTPAVEALHMTLKKFVSLHAQQFEKFLAENGIKEDSSAYANLKVALKNTVEAYTNAKNDHERLAAIAEFDTYGSTNLDFQEYMKWTKIDKIEGKLDLNKHATESGTQKGVVRKDARWASVWDQFVNAMSWITSGKAWSTADANMMNQFLSDTAKLRMAAMETTNDEKAASPKNTLRNSEGVTRAKPGANIGRLAAMLGPQLYGDMSKMAPVTVKELFQNSFDAVKDLGNNSGGRIDITTDPDARTITIKDNGKGMSPSTINKAFLTMAGTEKTSDRASGGFGIAKMLFLFGNKSLHLDTVRNGLRSVMDTTGADLMGSFDDETRAPDIHSTKTNAPNGTTITVTVPESYTNPSTKEQVKIDFVSSSTAPAGVLESPLFENIAVTYNGDPLNVGANFPKDNYTHFADVNFAWGNARIIVSTKTQPLYGSNVSVLSNGIYQFGAKIMKDPREPFGDVVPRRFYINVEPTVKPEDPGYPFELNRQGFSPAVKDDFGKIFNYLTMLYRGNQAAEVSQGFGTIAYVDSKGNTKGNESLAPAMEDVSDSTLHIKQGDSIAVKDGRLIVNGREVPVLTDKDLAKGQVDLSKFSIDQEKINPDEPMLHNNLGVIAGESEVGRLKAKLTAIRAEIDSAREARDAAYETWIASMDAAPRDADAIESARENHRALDKKADELSEARWVLEDQIRDAEETGTPEDRRPLSDVAFDKFGKKFGTLVHDISKVFMDVREAIASQSKEYAGSRMLAIGVSLDREYHGVHIRAPFHGMFVNPAALTYTDPREQAISLYSTMVHEVTHFQHSGHNAYFWAGDNELRHKLEVSGDDVTAKKKLRAILTKHADVVTFLREKANESTSKNIGTQLEDAGYQRVDAAMAKDGVTASAEPAGHDRGTGDNARSGQAGRADSSGIEGQQGPRAVEQVGVGSGVRESGGDSGAVTTLYSEAPSGTAPASLGVMGNTARPENLWSDHVSNPNFVEKSVKAMLPGLYGANPTAMNKIEAATAAAYDSIKTNAPALAKLIADFAPRVNVLAEHSRFLDIFKISKTAPLSPANALYRFLQNATIPQMTAVFRYMDHIKDTNGKPTDHHGLTEHQRNMAMEAKDAMDSVLSKATDEIRGKLDGMTYANMMTVIMKSEDVLASGFGVKNLKNLGRAGEAKPVDESGIVGFPEKSGRFYAVMKEGNIDKMVPVTSIDNYTLTAGETADKDVPYVYEGPVKGTKDHNFRPVATIEALAKSGKTGEAIGSAFLNTIHTIANANAVMNLTQSLAENPGDYVFKDKAALLKHLKKADVTVLPLGKNQAREGKMMERYRRPGEWVQVPDSANMGELRGKVVSGALWASIMDASNRQPLLNWELYNDMNTFWKGLMTVHNPSTSAGNFLSNFALAWMNDVPVKTVFGGIKLYGKYMIHPESLTTKERAIMKAFHQSGATVGSWATSEVRKVLSEAMLATTETSGKGLFATTRTLMNFNKNLESIAARYGKKAKMGGLAYHEFMTNLYAAGDNAFRLGSFMTTMADLEREGGHTYEEMLQTAGLKAQDEFLNYDIDSRAVKFAKGTFLPFVSFTYAASKRYAQIAKEKPWKLAEVALIYQIASAALLAATGDSDDEDKRKRARDKKLDTTWFGSYSNVRVPTVPGKTEYLELARWLPTPFSSKEQPNGFMGLHSFPQSLTPNGMVIGLLSSMYGVNLFTGKSINKDTDTDMQRLGNSVEAMVKSVEPSWVRKEVHPAVFGDAKTNSLGNEQSTGSRLAGSFLAPLTEVEDAAQERTRQNAVKAVTSQFDREATSLKHAMQTKKIDVQTYLQRLTALKETKKERINELRGAENGKAA